MKTRMRWCLSGMVLASSVGIACMPGADDSPSDPDEVAAVEGENQGGFNLGGANLGGTNLGGNNLGGTNLGGTNLGGANAGKNIHSLSASDKMLASGEDLYGGTTRTGRCIVNGIGSTAFAKLLGQNSGSTFYA